jgi:hypothetical protein
VRHQEETLREHITLCLRASLALAGRIEIGAWISSVGGANSQVMLDGPCPVSATSPYARRYQFSSKRLDDLIIFT